MQWLDDVTNAIAKQYMPTANRVANVSQQIAAQPDILSKSAVALGAAPGTIYRGAVDTLKPIGDVLVNKVAAPLAQGLGFSGAGPAPAQAAAPTTITPQPTTPNPALSAAQIYGGNDFMAKKALFERQSAIDAARQAAVAAAPPLPGSMEARPLARNVGGFEVLTADTRSATPPMNLNLGNPLTPRNLSEALELMKTRAAVQPKPMSGKDLIDRQLLQAVNSNFKGAVQAGQSDALQKLIENLIAAKGSNPLVLSASGE